MHVFLSISPLTVAFGTPYLTNRNPLLWYIILPLFSWLTWKLMQKIYKHPVSVVVNESELFREGKEFIQGRKTDFTFVCILS